VEHTGAALGTARTLEQVAHVDPWWLQNPSVSEFSRREAGRQRSEACPTTAGTSTGKGVIAGLINSQYSARTRHQFACRQPQQLAHPRPQQSLFHLGRISSERRSAAKSALVGQMKSADWAVDNLSPRSASSLIELSRRVVGP